MKKHETESIITLFCEEIKSIFKNNLVAIILTGSAGKDEFVDDWSDLDFLIISNSAVIEECVQIEELASRHPIHIGLTYLTLAELKTFKAPLRVLVSMYECNNGLNKILYSTIENLIPQVDIKLLTENNRYEMFLTMQKLRRNTQSQNLKKLFKNLVLLKKLLVRNKGHVVHRFAEIDELFYKYYDLKDTPVSHIFSIRDEEGTRALLEENVNILLNYVDDLEL